MYGHVDLFKDVVDVYILASKVLLIEYILKIDQLQVQGIHK